MSGWLEILNKFIEKTPLFPAGALWALTVLILRQFGILSDLKDEASWVWMFGIFCGWVTLVLLAEHAWKNWGSSLTERLAEWRSRAGEVEKLKILSNEQRYYLTYFKAKSMRYFQAWNRDDTLIGLRRMGLVRQHEETEPYYSRFEVPLHIWRELPELEPELKNRLPAEPPWERRLQSSRI